MNGYTKYVRYFVVERNLHRVICILMLLASVIFIQLTVLDDKQARLNNVLGEYRLVMRIPELQQAIQTKRQQILDAQPKPEPEPLAEPEPEVVEPLPPPPIESILQGTFMMDETLVTIIDGKQYQIGDIVQDYLILEITLNSVTLKNINTHEVKKLQFSGNETPQSSAVNPSAAPPETSGPAAQ